MMLRPCFGKDPPTICGDDCSEPAPFVPPRSDLVCVRSGRRLWCDYDEDEVIVRCPAAARVAAAALAAGSSSTGGSSSSVATVSKAESQRSRPLGSGEWGGATPRSPAALAAATEAAAVAAARLPPPPEEPQAEDSVNQGHAPPLQKAADPRELHMAVWLANRRRIAELVEAKVDINAFDTHGASPLLLAVELLPRARQYEHVVRYLLEHEADPRQRSVSGWSPIDVAVSRGDEQLVRIIFETCQRNMQVRWQTRLLPVVQSLRELPDFECRIRWEFESPVIPLFSKVAPSDTLLIRKRGACLRLDSTLASWKRFRLSKRRDLTTLFRGDNDASSSSSPGPSLCMLNHAKQIAVDVTANLDHDEASAVVEDLVNADAMQWDMKMDSVEVAESLGWLGQALGPCEVNGWKTTRFEVHGSLGIVVQRKGNKSNAATFEDYFGCPLPADACLPELQEEFMKERLPVPMKLGRECTSASELSNFTDVADLLEKQAACDDLFDLDTMSNASELLAQWPEPGSSAAIEKCDSRGCETALPPDSKIGFSMHSPSLSTHVGGGNKLPTNNGAAQARENLLGAERSWQGQSASASANRGAKKKRKEADQLGKSTRGVSASVWLATNFAISMQQFLPVLEALAAEHEGMHRLRELLASKTMQEACERAKRGAEVSGVSATSGHVFPIKVAVPLNLAVRALAHFELFEIRPSGHFHASIFEVPSNYSWVPRRQAQKTLSRRRKRMLLAHLAM